MCFKGNAYLFFGWYKFDEIGLHMCFKRECIFVLRGDANLFYGGYKFNENICAMVENTCAQNIGLGIQLTCWFQFLKYVF